MCFYLYTSFKRLSVKRVPIYCLVLVKKLQIQCITFIPRIQFGITLRNVIYNQQSLRTTHEYQIIIVLVKNVTDTRSVYNRRLKGR